MVPMLTITYYALIAYIKQVIRAETPGRERPRKRRSRKRGTTIKQMFIQVTLPTDQEIMFKYTLILET